MANDQHTELETELTLDQVKDQLIELGKKSSSLNYKDIMEKLSSFDQDPEQMDEFYEQLGDLGIEVVNDNDEEVTRLRQNDDPENNDGDDFNYDDDLSLPPGIKINDPVRMYLKEIGTVYRFFLLMMRWSWRNGSTMVMKKPNVDSQKRICVWL